MKLLACMFLTAGDLLRADSGQGGRSKPTKALAKGGRSLPGRNDPLYAVLSRIRHGGFDERPRLFLRLADQRDGFDLVDNQRNGLPAFDGCRRKPVLLLYKGGGNRRGSITGQTALKDEGRVPDLPQYAAPSRVVGGVGRDNHDAGRPYHFAWRD